MQMRFHWKRIHWTVFLHLMPFIILILLSFWKKSSEVIIEGGKIFIYTRLRSQNSRNIWGQHFPSFSEIETRLYELDEIENWIQSNGNLKLETIKQF